MGEAEGRVAPPDRDVSLFQVGKHPLLPAGPAEGVLLHDDAHGNAPCLSALKGSQNLLVTEQIDFQVNGASSGIQLRENWCPPIIWLDEDADGARLGRVRLGWLRKAGRRGRTRGRSDGERG